MNTPQQNVQSKQYTQSQFRSHLSQQSHTSGIPGNNASNPVMLTTPITPVPATAPTVVLFPVSQKTTQTIGQMPLSGIPVSRVSPVSSPSPTSPTPLKSASSTPTAPDSQDSFLLESKPPPKPRRSLTKVIAVVLVIVLAAAIYVIWQPVSPPSSSSTNTIQNSGNTDTSGGGSASNGGTTANNTNGYIQVYVLGAVKTPGLYTLPPGARVFDLIKAAGGTLPNANLVALNMAAKLTDGEEVYVTVIGETPPAYSGGVPGLNGGNGGSSGGGGSGGSGTPGTTGTGTTGTGQIVNINTASVTELKEYLHVSSKTAQAIVDYRTQNGDYTSVDQLLQVISKAIYDRIRTQCTV